MYTSCTHLKTQRYTLHLTKKMSLRELFTTLPRSIQELVVLYTDMSSKQEMIFFDELTYLVDFWKKKYNFHGGYDRYGEYYSTIDYDGNYYVRHSLFDVPAVNVRSMGGLGIQWYSLGRLHRDNDSPADISLFDQKFYQNGLLYKGYNFKKEMYTDYLHLPGRRPVVHSTQHSTSGGYFLNGIKFLRNHWKKLIARGRIPVFYSEKKERLSDYEPFSHYQRRSRLEDIYRQAQYCRPKYPMKEEKEMTNKIEEEVYRDDRREKFTLQWYYKQRSNTVPGFLEYNVAEQSLELLDESMRVVHTRHKDAKLW